MLASFLIMLREGLEAALIVGIVMAYLLKLGRPTWTRYAWMGVAAATGVSLVAAIALQIAGAELEGAAEQIFEGLTMFAAAAILTWMILWMARQSRLIKGELHRKVDLAVARGQQWGIFGITFFAVVREGIETALFMNAAVFGASNNFQVALGGALGLGGAIFLGYLLFASSRRLNLRTFFNVTGVLLLLFAAGLFAHGVHEFQEAGLLPVLVEHMWDTSGILSQQSLMGAILRSLFGYADKPSLLEVLSYVGYFVIVFWSTRWFSSRPVTQPA